MDAVFRLEVSTAVPRTHSPGVEPAIRCRAAEPMMNPMGWAAELKTEFSG
jgi:hypothetical protein